MSNYGRSLCLKEMTQDRLMVAGDANSKCEQLIKNLILEGILRISPEGKLKLRLLSRTLLRFYIQSGKMTPYI